MKSALTIAVMLIGLLGAPVALKAAPPSHDQEKKQLQSRFEERYPAIRDAKRGGKIGENSEGMLEGVKGDLDATLQKLVDDENTDRKALYKLIADDEKTTPQAVARRAAQRNFEKAKKGEYIKEDGKWRQK